MSPTFIENLDRNKKILKIDFDKNNNLFEGSCKTHDSAS